MKDEQKQNARPAVAAMLDVLADEGISMIFGNPGSTEMPLMEALVERTDIEYVLALQEASAVGMADGYAQATGRAAFVNLHTAGGLGNAMGALVNAKNTNTPMVVTAGQQDTRHVFTDPWLSGDLTAMAAPVSKWSHEVRSAREIAPALRRAFAIANAHPRGPVFLSLPMNLLDETVSENVPRRSAAPLPAPADVSGFLIWYRAQQLGLRIALLLSDAVVQTHAVREAVAAAEALDADVYGTPLAGGNLFPTTHPLWKGMLPPSFVGVRAKLAGYDVALMVGDHALLAYPYSEGAPIPSTVKFMQISAVAEKLGHDASAEIAMHGDPRLTLAEIVRALGAGTARNRLQDDGSNVQRLRQQRAPGGPLHPKVAVEAVLAARPAGMPIVNEAPCTFGAVRELWMTTEDDRYYFVRGGALGFGMPAAVGVSLARARQRVLCFMGDGATMYSPQGLWSAARYCAPVKYIVFNNQKYDILMRVAKELGGVHSAADRFVGMTIDAPAVDFDALARTARLPYTRLGTVDEILDQLPAILNNDDPWMVEVDVTGL
ncbi:UNVERIFIED_ORG: benzoylformate decarboxylase [Variovorax guangxiensis]|jgi:benzoylformate decarboxylase